MLLFKCDIESCFIDFSKFFKGDSICANNVRVKANISISKFDFFDRELKLKNNTRV